MMKKIIFPLLFLITVLSALAYTPMPTFPHVVFGEITSEGYAVSNLEVRVKNLNSGNEQIVNTNENGVYQADLANFDQDYRYGDVAEVCLVYCEDVRGDNCCKEAVIGDSPNEGGTNIVFDVDEDVTDDGNQIIIPDDATIVRYKSCWDGTEVLYSDACPVRVVCSDGSEVHSEDECPSDYSLLYQSIIVLAIAILGIFGWGAGFTALANYYYKKGKEYEKQGKKKLAQKNYDRAMKMLKTALKKAKEGKYKVKK